MNITLTNNFHNTTANVKPVSQDAAGWWRLNAAQVKRVAKKLCPVKGCVCGHGPLNTRGPQEVAIDDTGDEVKLHLVPAYDYSE